VSWKLLKGPPQTGTFPRLSWHRYVSFQWMRCGLYPWRHRYVGNWLVLALGSMTTGTHHCHVECLVVLRLCRSIIVHDNRHHQVSPQDFDENTPAEEIIVTGCADIAWDDIWWSVPHQKNKIHRDRRYVSALAQEKPFDKPTDSIMNHAPILLPRAKHVA
jgi:hypothetical protein